MLKFADSKAQPSELLDSFTITHHLNEDTSKASYILVDYEGTLKEDYLPDNERYKHSEMLLYKRSLLDEASGSGQGTRRAQKQFGNNCHYFFLCCWVYHRTATSWMPLGVVSLYVVSHIRGEAHPILP
ncbi:hypothetical protein GOP47_0018260 [Adiantum capillus-veneris]|uniref:Uncharacterized protein n=1 Tax=Adiantum capillus-veneris TaxID=13818 RepID=A0A9D4ZBF4_ADICA|nr:hypothetical protein GOP47_0018260 [Adiantum capillus-veneris]